MSADVKLGHKLLNLLHLVLRNSKHFIFNVKRYSEFYEAPK